MFPHHLLACYYQNSPSFPLESDSSNCIHSPPIEPEAYLSELLALPHTSSFHDTPATSAAHLRATQRPDLFATLLYDREGAYRNDTTSVSSSPAKRFDSLRESRSAYRCNTSEASYNQSFTLSPHAGQTHGSEIVCRVFPSQLVKEGKGSSEQSMSLVPHPKQEQEALEMGKRLGRLSTKSKGRTTESRSKKRTAPKYENIEGRASKITKTDPKANIGKKVDNSSSLVCTNTLPYEVIEISDSDTEVITLKEESNDHHQGQEQSSMPLHNRASRQTRDTALMSLKLTKFDKKVDRNCGKLDSLPTTTQNVNEVEELQNVRQELRIAQNIVRRLQQDLEKNKSGALLDELKAKSNHGQEMNSLARQLEDERQGARVTTQDCNQLREQIRTLKEENVQLLAEVQSLRAATLPPKILPVRISPVPSTTSSTKEEKREDNVRKMYIQVKRQFDILHSVARDLARCTSSLDLSSFGEFGKHLRKLRSSLEMTGITNDRQALVVRRSDDDDD
jgi:regulator of replication initiation timing